MRLLRVDLRSAVLVFLLNLTIAENEGHPSDTEIDRNVIWCQRHIGNIKLFEVFPGMGWDNLRNVEGGQVAKYTFNQCKLTDDGRYLIPDNVFTIPLKKSHIERSAQMFEHWENTSSLTSRSINVNVGLSYAGVSISGSFSHEKSDSKARQVQNEAVIIRVKTQFNRYEAKLQPHYPPSDAFKKSVLSLAARIELNQTEMATYEAQILIRDFGTHVLTGVTAGAALVKDDYISKQYIASQTSSKKDILATASASYLLYFKADSSLRQQTKKSVDDSYKSSTSYSTITALGGPIIEVEDLKIDQWTKEIGSNLVAMDRTGDPLFFLITSERFPELPPHLISPVTTHVREAIKTYYKINMIPGCTTPGTPEFSPFANINDGSCKTHPAPVMFGGVYQECYVIGEYLYIPPCAGKTSENPKTGGYSCPPKYRPIKIFSGQISKMESRRSCHGCGLFWIWSCCHTDYHVGIGQYHTYWCVNSDNATSDTGYHFGGVYTSTSPNLVTGTKGCPKYFRTMKLLSDLTICVLDAFELTTFSIPFAGFFSCRSGNPLGTPQGVRANFWPKRCPEGFSQHLATVISGCSIYYCAQTGALTGVNLPAIKRPPFMLKPDLHMSKVDASYVFDRDAKTWHRPHEVAHVVHDPHDETGLNVSAFYSSSAVSVKTGMCILFSLLHTLAHEVTQ